MPPLLRQRAAAGAAAMTAPGAPAWSCVAQARRHDPQARVPFAIGHRGVPVRAGSVARAALPVLQRWPQHLHVQAQGVTLTCRAADRDACLQELNRQLHRLGWIRGWRDEAFAVPPIGGGAPLAHMERAAARFWGTLTLGAHCNAFVVDAQGRLQIWVARRSATKPTDPGLLDNLVGGGVPRGQSPLQALVREGWEEAGLPAPTMAQARPVGTLHLYRDIPEGLQHEELHMFDLQLPAQTQPHNQDGEVAGMELLPWEQALAHAAGPGMTVDAALVTLDFVRRRGLLRDAALERGMAALRQRPAA